MDKENNIMNNGNEKPKDGFDDILDSVTEMLNEMIPIRMSNVAGEKILDKANDILESAKKEGVIYDYAAMMRNVVTDTNTSMYVGGEKNATTSKWQMVLLLKRQPKDEYTVLPITFVDNTVVTARCEFRQGWESAKKTIRAMQIKDVEQEKGAIIEVLDNAFKAVKEKVHEIQTKVDIIQTDTSKGVYEIHPMWKLMEHDNWDNPWCCLVVNGQNVKESD